ncbi:hypothetical protein M427DRAFT_27371 [Gonapodya prolifera JEL478]|uniref:Pentacotripeptide-repeat region of PRORP domain-containing protein n=1 Tax=Gonapodya prolifera (strain JEL478) TaxID=1344416 RepID=A0A139AYM1_GONPJ|nr:hypothetical protein M427DRAFT_27371 [Gonapodya prolifera JEL478]|eukprot:KXS21800.1 hypothetical protein M427DRAFT_27371 [Gonapodya prolifera JEL478]
MAARIGAALGTSAVDALLRATPGGVQGIARLDRASCGGGRTKAMCLAASASGSIRGYGTEGRGRSHSRSRSKAEGGDDARMQGRAGTALEHRFEAFEARSVSGYSTERRGTSQSETTMAKGEGGDGDAQMQGGEVWTTLQHHSLEHGQTRPAGFYSSKSALTTKTEKSSPAPDSFQPDEDGSNPGTAQSLPSPHSPAERQIARALAPDTRDVVGALRIYADALARYDDDPHLAHSSAVPPSEFVGKVNWVWEHKKYHQAFPLTRFLVTRLVWFGHVNDAFSVVIARLDHLERVLKAGLAAKKKDVPSGLSPSTRPGSLLSLVPKPPSGPPLPLPAEYPNLNLPDVPPHIPLNILTLYIMHQTLPHFFLAKFRNLTPSAASSQLFHAILYRTLELQPLVDAFGDDLPDRSHVYVLANPFRSFPLQDLATSLSKSATAATTAIATAPATASATLLPLRALISCARSLHDTPIVDAKGVRCVTPSEATNLELAHAERMLVKALVAHGESDVAAREAQIAMKRMLRSAAIETRRSERRRHMSATTTPPNPIHVRHAHPPRRPTVSILGLKVPAPSLETPIAESYQLPSFPPLPARQSAVAYHLIRLLSTSATPLTAVNLFCTAYELWLREMGWWNDLQLGRLDLDVAVPMPDWAEDKFQFSPDPAHLSALGMALLAMSQPATALRLFLLRTRVPDLRPRPADMATFLCHPTVLLPSLPQPAPSYNQAVRLLATLGYSNDPEVWSSILRHLVEDIPNSRPARVRAVVALVARHGIVLDSSATRAMLEYSIVRGRAWEAASWVEKWDRNVQIALATRFVVVVRQAIENVQQGRPLRVGKAADEDEEEGDRDLNTLIATTKTLHSRLLKIRARTPGAPDLSYFTSLLQVAARSDDPTWSSAILREMKQRGVKPDAWAFHAALEGISRVGDVEGARKVVAKLEKTGGAGLIGWTHLVQTYVKRGDMVGAERAARQGRVESDPVVATVLIKGYKAAGNAHGATSVVANVVESHGLEALDVRLLTAACGAFADADNIDGWQNIVEPGMNRWWHEGRMDNKACAAMVDASIKMNNGTSVRRWWNRYWEWLAKHNKNIERDTLEWPDGTIVNTVYGFLLKHGELVPMLQPSINGGAVSSVKLLFPEKLGPADEFIAMVAARSPRSGIPDGVTWNMRVHHVGVVQGSAERAEKEFNEMVENGRKPNATNFSTLLNVFAKLARNDLARFYLKRMQVLGVQPDERCLSAVVEANGRAGDGQGVLDAIDELLGHPEESKLSSPSGPLTALSDAGLSVTFDALGFVGLLNPAQRLWNDLIVATSGQKKIPANAAASYAECLARCGNIKEAISFLVEEYEDAVGSTADMKSWVGVVGLAEKAAREGRLSEKEAKDMWKIMQEVGGEQLKSDVQAKAFEKLLDHERRVNELTAALLQAQEVRDLMEGKRRPRGNVGEDFEFAAMTFAQDLVGIAQQFEDFQIAESTDTSAMVSFDPRTEGDYDAAQELAALFEQLHVQEARDREVAVLYFQSSPLRTITAFTTTRYPSDAPWNPLGSAI